MAYTPNTWAKGDVITSAKLNNIETGIEAINADTIEINSTVKEISSSVDKVTETVTATGANIDTLTAKISDLNAAIAKVSVSIMDLPDRLVALEDTVRDLKKTNVTTITDPSAQFANADMDAEIGEVTLKAGKAAGITAKTISFKGTAADSSTISLKATGAVTMNDVKSSGTLAKSISNAAWCINTDDEVIIRDCDFSQSGYNCVEVGLSATAPKTVVIENCKFGDLTNNAISVFSTQNNATITVKNCELGNISQLLRISNRDNVSHLTINVVNVNIKGIDAGVNGQFLLGQDYTAATADAAEADNRFGTDKVTVNLSNVTIGGELVTDTGIFMVYRDKSGYVDASKTEAFPTINIL